MTQAIPNADLVSIEISELVITVERVMADDVVTEAEKRRVRGKYKPLQRLARWSAVMQQVGIRMIRVGKPDKNLLTMLKSLIGGQEKAAVDWNSTTADEFELAA